MAEEKKKKKKGSGKKGIAAIAGVILAIILIIVLLASFIFSIFEAIVVFIKNVVLGIINGVLNFLSHPIKCTIQALGALGNFLASNTNQTFNGAALEKTQPKQLIEVSQEEFTAMRDAIDKSINRNTAGLDDMMLKKMLLAYNTGKYSTESDIIIELTSDEANEYKRDSSNTFKVKRGNELEQLKLNAYDIISSHINQMFENDKEKKEAIKAERNEKISKQNKYYLHAKGILKFVNESGEELVYYNEDVLKKLYKDEYYAKKDWENRDYAESVWNYLSSKCYTDGANGIKIYAYEKIEEEVIDWSFIDNDDGSWFDNDWLKIAINKQLISNYSKERNFQEIDYYSLVSKYSTPVEFMIDLLNISSSREFVNSFIDKVVNQTTIELKLYKARQSSGKEVTEKIEETTKVKAEAIVTAKVTKVDYDGDAEGYKDEDAGIKTKVTLSGGTTLFGIDTLKIKVNLTNIPKKVQAAAVEIKFAEDSSTKTYYVPGGASDAINLFTDLLGTSDTLEVEAWFTTRYKTKTNTGKIEKITRQLTTETKLDIAVEKVITWYGKVTYDNYIQNTTTWDSIDNNGVKVNIVSNNPIMNSKTKSDEVYTRDDSNKNTIFNTSNTIGDYTSKEIMGRIENWYANLTSDNIMYWGTGGPLTHKIYEWLDGDRGRSLSTEEELLNIRYTFAMEEGWGDSFTKKTYTPFEMTCKSDKYEIGYLYTTVNNYLVKGLPKFEDNTDFFLSLLKNNTGTYNRNATYNPNGKEIVYKDIYEGNTRVARFFINGAEMLFDLLDRSPNTEGLSDIMRYTLYKYNNTNYGVTEFNYELFEKAGFKKVNDQ